MKIRLITSCNVQKELDKVGYNYKYVPRLLYFVFPSADAESGELVVYPSEAMVETMGEQVQDRLADIVTLDATEVAIMRNAPSVKLLYSFEFDAHDIKLRELVMDTLSDDPMQILALFAIDDDGDTINLADKNISYGICAPE